MARDTVVLVGRTEQRLESGRRTVARGASDCFVRAYELISISEGSVIERGSRPAVCAVAVDTGGREAGALVLFVVLGLVARDTVVLVGRTEQRLEPGRRTVAGRTRQRFVGSNELISVREGSVVEGRSFPGIRAVAIDAGGREAGARVFFVVLGLMARDTVVLVGWIEQRLKPWRRAVAGRARHRIVGPDEVHSRSRARHDRTWRPTMSPCRGNRGTSLGIPCPGAPRCTWPDGT